MRTDIEYTNRQLIPRWLTYNKACLLNFRSNFNAQPINEVEKTNYDIAIEEWKQNKSISYAQNIIASAHTLELEQDVYYREAIDYLIAKDFDKNTLFENMLGKRDNNPICCHEKENDSASSMEIHKTRKLVRDYPNDSLRWMDLAYCYLVAGNQRNAEKYIRVALSLNSSNAHIIRSAARYFVYKEDPEKALHIIRTASSFNSNPLLLSSEISICEAFDMKSRAIKNAREKLFDRNFSLGQLSELNATFATLEFNNGSSKKGKKFLENALSTPNENTLAQAQFLIRKFDGSFDPTRFEIPCRYEADAWNYYQKMDFKDSLLQARQWFYYQPFSSRPAVLYSYLQSLIFENNAEAIRLLNDALRLSKCDFSLINNKTVALAQNGNIKEAILELEKLKSFTDIDEGERGVMLATMGLIEYRKSNSMLGRKYYKEAIDILKKLKHQSRECIAYYYWYREEEKFDKVESDKLYQITKEIAEKYNYTDIKYKLKIET